MAPSDDSAGSAARLETRRRRGAGRPAYGAEGEERGAPDVIAEADDDDDDDEATAGMVTAYRYEMAGKRRRKHRPKHVEGRVQGS